MDSPIDQFEHEPPSDPQESSVLVANSDEASVDNDDTISGLSSESIIETSVEAPVESMPGAWHTSDFQSKSEPPQADLAPQLRFGPYSNRYVPLHHSYRLSRDELREIAAATLDALDDGFYYPPAVNVEPEEEEEEKGGETEMEDDKNIEREVEESQKEDEKSEHNTDEEVHSGDKAEDLEDQVENSEDKTEISEDKAENSEDKVENSEDKAENSEDKAENIVNHRKAGREPYDLKTKIRHTNDHTQFIAPDDENMSLWYQADLLASKGDETEKKTKIIIAEYSTLVGSKRLEEITRDEAESRGTIGVLNFASAKKPGGGFMNGSQAQEESLARSSTLYASLLTPRARHFYRLYSTDPDNAFYTHGMVYSPSIVIFRDDKGDWTAPLEVDILTSAAVNAGDVRKQVRWEEEMRTLRERVRVAELARRRELSLPSFAPTHVRIYESEPQREDGPESGQQSSAHSELPSTQVSPIIFAADPPSPPLEPLSLPSSNLIPPGSQILGATSTQPPSSPYPPPTVDPITQAEILIAAVMYERVARILYLFHLQGAKRLVLGSFGTGVFQNSVELIARIFRDLLCGPETGEGKTEGQKEGDQGNEDGGVKAEGSPFADINPQYRGKFKDVFDTVMFAILGGSTVTTFRDIFEGAEGVEYDEEAEGSEVEGMKDGPVSDGCDPPA